MVRNDVMAALYGAVLVGNSVLRVMSDAMAGLAHLVLRYIDWLALQLLPDTAEKEWLDRHGNIWLVNADGTIGRKSATFASGAATATGMVGSIIPAATPMNALGVNYETMAETIIGSGPTPVSVPIQALDPGSIGNMSEGDSITFTVPIAGVDTSATIVSMKGGADTETDDQLRSRILFRIRNPPMGGDIADYIIWATSVPGVTRAWAACEIGPGTITVRFMMDDLRADNNGLPEPDDVLVVSDYIDSVRPVTVKDCFVFAPAFFFYNITITQLTDDTPEVRARIEQSIKDMDLAKSAPGQTMYRSWVNEAISIAIGEISHELIFDTTPMPSMAYMPKCGTILYE
jgi:uncharacterized phage protein gp47/JayE